MNFPVETHQTYRTKISIVFVVLFLSFCVLLLRAYQLQILDNTRVENLAQNQTQAKVVLSPRRGAIYDRQGTALALDVMVSSVGIHPWQIREPAKAKGALLATTNVSATTLDEKLASKKKFEFIERRIPAKAGRLLEQQKIDGIQIVNEYRRYYPYKELAGQLLGAVGYDAKALGGIELSFDDYLLVEPEKLKIMRDARGKIFSQIDAKESSYDVYLTIDKDVQYYAEQALTEYGEKHGARYGFAIVTDVGTGEILALANYPAFNPNLYWKYSQALWKNHAIIDEFEPGSTFKTITMAAALQTGKVKPTDKFFCENGNYRIGHNTVEDTHKYGWLTAREILKVSSNIGITKVAQKTGRKNLYEMIKAFGFGEMSHLGLVGESDGSIRSYKTWRDIEFSNIAFGQGLSVNGLQMARMYGMVANGGDLYPLSLIKKIVNSDGEIVYENKPRAEKNVLSPTVAAELRQMLYQVTQPGGTARLANVEGYAAGGKTGTAQKFNVDLRAYEEKAFTSSFVGFAPLDKPRFAVSVVFDRPSKNGYFGGIVAAPAFKEIAQKTLAHFGVAPPVVQQNVTVVGDLKNRRDSFVPQNTTTNTTTVEEIANNKVFDAAFQRSLLPDLRGLSLRRALVVTQNQDIHVAISGQGVVVDQIPQAGTAVKKGDTVTLKLAAR